MSTKKPWKNTFLGKEERKGRKGTEEKERKGKKRKSKRERKRKEKKGKKRKRKEKQKGKERKQSLSNHSKWGDGVETLFRILPLLGGDY